MLAVDQIEKAIGKKTALIRVRWAHNPWTKTNINRPHPAPDESRILQRSRRLL